MTAALFPHPLLSATIAVVWILLANEPTPGAIVLAMIVGVAVPKFTSVYWPDRPRVRNPRMIAEYLLVVLWDIVVSNVQVARLVLFRRPEDLQSCFVVVPIELESPEAVTVLAGTITMTPGTLTVDHDPVRRTLLVHCLHAPDPDEVVASIIARYESRLRSIFR
ncbi:MAG: Na+/H+ antiporter subunit E [Thalassobaculum sp.]|uniref:Na+/H+ antiporter subunit E n=1 Tax=Thalassobaculum sp. TaxID=2022740 RepID=UPI0032EEC5D4